MSCEFEWTDSCQLHPDTSLPTRRAAAVGSLLPAAGSDVRRAAGSGLLDPAQSAAAAAGRCSPVVSLSFL